MPRSRRGCSRIFGKARHDVLLKCVVPVVALSALGLLLGRRLSENASLAEVAVRADVAKLSVAAASLPIHDPPAARQPEPGNFTSRPAAAAATASTAERFWQRCDTCHQDHPGDKKCDPDIRDVTWTAASASQSMCCDCKVATSCDDKVGEETVHTVWAPFANGKRQNARCAVVSSSDKLIGKNLGQRIDSHDFVFRTNFAPTRNHEHDVGSRTDAILANFLVLSNDPSRGGAASPTPLFGYFLEHTPSRAIKEKVGVPMVIIFDSVLVTPWTGVKEAGRTAGVLSKFGAKWRCAALRQCMERCSVKSGAPHCQCALFPRSLLSTVYRLWLQANATRSCLRKPKCVPSSGFVTVALATALCRETTAFGYGVLPNASDDATDFFSQDARHYYDDDALIARWIKQTGNKPAQRFHNFALERAALQAWNNTGMVRDGVEGDSRFTIVPL